MKFSLIKRNRLGEMATTDAGYKDACYYVRFMIDGKSFCRSTKWTVQDDAEKAAKDIYKLCLKESLAASMGIVAPKVVLPATTKVATVADLCAFYKAAPGHAGLKTRDANVAQLLKSIERVQPDNEDVGSLPYTVIDGALAIAWFQAVQETNVRMAHDQVTVTHNRNTANANFIKIGSMFTEALLEQYENAGYNTAGFAAFRSKGKNRRFKKGVSKGINPYNPPAQPIIDAVLAAWMQLTDRNMFVAAGFALSFGLRKGETLQVKWGWLRLLYGGKPGLSNANETAVVKAGTGSLEARALEPYYSAFMRRLDEMGWRGADNELVITGGKGGGVAERKTQCWERLGKWLIQLGWTTDKKSHALRAYSGSKVYLRYGLETAQRFLRHAKASTTEQYYCHFASKFPLTDEERTEMPEHFARTVAAAGTGPTNILSLPVAVVATETLPAAVNQ